VDRAIELLAAEIDRNMVMMGVGTVDALSREMLVPA